MYCVLPLKLSRCQGKINFYVSKQAPDFPPLPRFKLTLMFCKSTDSIRPGPLYSPRRDPHSHELWRSTGRRTAFKFRVVRLE